LTLSEAEWVKGRWRGRHSAHYRGGDGNLYVRYLYWNGERWNWNYNWLDNDWSGGNPAAVPANRFVSLLTFYVRRVFLKLAVPAAQHSADFIQRRGTRKHENTKI